MKIVINKAYGGFNISKRFFDYYDIPHTDCNENEDYVRCLDKNFDERRDPRLIEFIEKFGSKEASGQYSALAIEEIPKGTAYRIDNYDGYESIEYRDMTEWEIAD